MARTKKRKAATVAGVSVLTAALLLGGTFAWQSISQMALNENKASVNPGARLHDDYSGNYAKSTAKAVSDVGVKRVYVENFTDEQDKVSVIARVRLDEYMEIGGSAGYKTVTTTENGNNVAPYTNGVVTVSETKENNGDVKITLTALPYTGYKVDSVTADTSNAFTPESSGVYTYTYTPVTGGSGTTTPVNIAVSFVKDNNNDYTGDTVDPAVSLETNAKIDDVKTWKTYIPETDDDGNLKENTASAFRDYVTLNFGWDSKYDTKGIYYMPTFNKNKDSLTADINGTYAAGFSDYKEYTSSDTETANAKYDADANNIDEGVNALVNVNYTETSEKHTATAIDKTKSKVISMAQWKDDYKMASGDYWVYDTDGWAYWANLLEPETATGLFLSRNEMTGTPEDNWYYGMNVVGQFVTSEDIGSDSNKVGFYADDAGEKPSADAKTLLGILKTLNQTTPLTLTSGDKTEITSMKSGVVPTALTDNDGGTWTVMDEKVVAVTVDEDGKVWAQAKKPGDAVIVYTSSANEVTAVRVHVDYQTYEITQNLVNDIDTDDIFEQVVKYADDEDGNKNAKLTIKGYYDANDVYYQVAIGKEAFKENKTITSLILEEGISSIGASAFYNCEKLGGILEIPGSVSKVGTSAFFLTACEELVIHEGVRVLGSSSFIVCKNLKKVELPSSIEFLDNAVFYGSPVEELSFPNGNPVYCVDGLVLYKYEGDPENKTELIYYAGGKEDTSFTIPSTVTLIGANAFRSNAHIQEVTIPDSVTKIGHAAFMTCPFLTTVTIPKNVSEIVSGAFAGTSALSALSVDPDNQFYQVIGGILYDKDVTVLLCCPGGVAGTVAIPEGVKRIEELAFMSQFRITEIQIPKSMETIPATAVDSFQSLKKIVYAGTQAEWNATSFAKLSAFSGLEIVCSDTPSGN